MGDNAEKQRRELQNRIRAMVVEMRAAGKSEQEINKAKNALKRPSNGSKGPRRQDREWEHGTKNKQQDGNRKRARDEYFTRDFQGGGGKNKDRARPFKQGRGNDDDEDPEKSQKRDELAKKHDVVIIPIMWRKRETEADFVLEAAQQLKDRLAAHRINTWIDRRHSLTPGQKYEYWESVGVKFRLEMGPEEVKNHAVCLSKAIEGELAKRWKDVKIQSGEALHDLLTILRDEGLKWLKLDEEPCSKCEQVATSTTDAPAPKKARTNKESVSAAQRTHVQFGDSSDEDDDEAPTSTKSKVNHTSGDTLEENYIL